MNKHRLDCGADFVERIQVLTNTEITVCLAVVMTAANLYWSYLNWRTYQGQKKIMSEALLSDDQIKAQALDFLRTAEAKAAQFASEQEYKVCSVCHRIASKHTTDEQGVTVCAEAAPGLHAKRQLHREQLHDDQLYNHACESPDA